ncbi:MAG: hypothetical protein ACR2N4_08040 [Jatrophihabitans sp.]
MLCLCLGTAVSSAGPASTVAQPKLQASDPINDPNCPVADPTPLQNAPYPGLLPFSAYSSDLGGFLAGKSVIGKAAVQLSLPTLLAHVYSGYSFTYGYRKDLPGSNSDPVDYPYGDCVLDLYSPAWIVSPPGSAQAHGILPPIRASVLGFGAVPVTVTVYLRQPVRAGMVQPIDIHSLAGLNINFDYGTVIDARFDMRIADVEVDRVPLDVGPNCHTVTPAQLDLKSPSSDEYNVLAGGALNGGLAIPAFTGCRSASDENLSPLLTGMISSPASRNPVTQEQGTLGNWIPDQQTCAGPPPATANDCSQPPPPVNPPHV